MSYDWTKEQLTIFDTALATKSNTQGGTCSNFDPVYNLIKVEATAG